MRDFTSALWEYRGARIAIYGLGAQAEELLQQLEGVFQIVCLLDGYRESGVMS